MIRSKEAKERALARSRAWKDANRERVRTSRAAYFQRNKDKEYESGLRWKRENPGRVAIYAEKHAPQIRDWQASRKAERYGAAAMFKPMDVRADYNSCCWACGGRGRLGIDHIVPLSRGGSNFAFNVRILCASCNSKKHNRLDHEVSDHAFRMSLLIGHAAMMEVLQ